MGMLALAVALGAARCAPEPAAAPSPNGTAPPVLFRTADACMACHNGLTTPLGEDVSIGAAWRASMMANAARDPYWQAAVRREIMDHPRAAAAIENECATCHMPMAQYEARVSGRRESVFAHLPAGSATTRAGTLAADGVSCTLCHQTGPERLGTPESFTGGFVVDTAQPWGQRSVFGPFQVDTGRATIMHSATGFRPTAATHLSASETCATCHTLYTHARGAQGEVIAELPEQVPYLEWRHSAYRTERSCQSCHMPVVKDSMAIASVLGVPRPQLSRHDFRGGNFFVLRMLTRYRAELGVTALPQELDAAATQAEAFLREQTAIITVPRVAIADGRLVAEVMVKNLAGHKLPTAYPSRRAWLHVTVHDASGRLVFESGRLSPNGAIEGNDNDHDRTRYEPHYVEITRPEQVQIYEAIMVDGRGAVTTGLLTAIRYAKDNRLLPRGFEKATAGPDFAVYGAAITDADFHADGDRVRYVVDVGAADGPFRVDAALWYQPIGFRWAENLRPYRSMETDRFIGYYEAMAAASALLVAQGSATTR